MFLLYYFSLVIGFSDNNNNWNSLFISKFNIGVNMRNKVARKLRQITVNLHQDRKFYRRLKKLYPQYKQEIMKGETNVIKSLA